PPASAMAMPTMPESASRAKRAWPARSSASARRSALMSRKTITVPRAAASAPWIGAARRESRDGLDEGQRADQRHAGRERARAPAADRGAAVDDERRAGEDARPRGVDLHRGKRRVDLAQSAKSNAHPAKTSAPTASVTMPPMSEPRSSARTTAGAAGTSAVETVASRRLPNRRSLPRPA